MMKLVGIAIMVGSSGCSNPATHTTIHSFELQAKNDSMFLPYAIDGAEPVFAKGRAAKHSTPLTQVRIGVGSGAEGYESITITDDGNVFVVRQAKPGSPRFRGFSGKIYASVALQFLKSASSDVNGLRESYTTNLSDGGQGFLFALSKNSVSLSNFSNCYPAAFSRLWWRANELVAAQPRSLWSRTQVVDGFTVSKEARGRSLHNHH